MKRFLLVMTVLLLVGIALHPQSSNYPASSTTPPTYPESISNFSLSEEWCGGVAAEGTVGSLGWFTEFSSGGSGTGYFRRDASNADTNHPCTVAFHTGTGQAGTSSGTYLRFCGGLTWDTLAHSQACSGTNAQGVTNVGDGGTFPPLNSQIFDSFYVFKLSQTTNENVGVGFEGLCMPQFECSPSTSSIAILYETANSDTHYIYETSGASAQTRVDSGIAPTANVWVKARIRSVTPGTILFSMCQGGSATAGCTLGAETAISTNLETINVHPDLRIHSVTAVDDVMIWNYWSFTMPVGR